MTVSKHLLVLSLIVLLLTACSGTKITNTWADQDYKGQLKNLYIIGIAKDDLNRMIFEDAFKNKFVREGIKSVSSYTDLPIKQEVNRKAIIPRMYANNCDSVLLTRLIGQRTKAKVSTGKRRVSRSGPGPVYRGGGYKRPAYYNNWHDYYQTSYTTVRMEASVTSFVALTVESVLYDLKSEELIWSALLETDLEGNFELMVQKYVDKVAKDLKKKGFI